MDLAARFRAVARERIARVRDLIAALARTPDDASLAEALGRELHTLKGEARIVGRAEIATAVHALEDLSGDGPRLRAALDALERALEPAPEGTVRLARLATASDAFVRVDAGLLSRLAATTAELRVGHGELAPALDELVTLEQALPPEAASRLRATLARLRQTVFDQGHRLEQLLDGVQAARMVRLAGLLTPFVGAARELAVSLGKSLEVELSGDDVELDQHVVELLREPLVHLVQNAVDHGLETPAERARRHKPAAGRLTLRASTQGASVRVDVEDDGRGIDAAALEGALRRRGERAEIPDDPDALLELLCRHGLSSRATATEHSGRGVGLDVVKRRTESIGGRLTLASAPGLGTTFSIEVPITTALTTLACVEVDGRVYGLAPSELEAAHAMEDVTVERAGAGLVVRLGDGPLPLADLGALLGGPPRDPRVRRALVIAVHRQSRLALAVDRFTGTRPVVQQRLDAFLEGATAVRSIAVLTAGALAVVLDLPELIARRQRVSLASVAPPAPRRKVALVVDDSELTRDVLVAALRELGLEVREAANGKLALEALDEAQPDVVLTDLDMPVLDGFGLLEALRARRARVPVVVLSTRGAEADIRRAETLGARAYLVKTRLELEELRQVVSAELAAAEVA